MSTPPSLFPWQRDAWASLHKIRGQLPHAILFHGREGIGKTAFAETFAQAMLCEQPAEQGLPCGNCVSCGWFAQDSHPDFRRVRPEIYEEAEPADEAGDAADGARKPARSSKAPSREIKIDQIRALTDFMNVSTHRQGLRVVALYPADALNTAAANALLKTLEEPPPGTLFLLVSHSLDRLMPTVLSRCHKFALAVPSREAALAWLETQGVPQADVWLAEQGGAPLAAHAQSQAETRELMDEFLRQLARPGSDNALKAAERLQKANVPELVLGLQRWLYDVFSCKLAGNVRYYPRYRKELEALAARADVHALAGGIRAAGERRAIAEHPLSARLFIEDMLLEYSGVFSG